VIVGMAVATVLLLLAFVLVERRAEEPVMPLELFDNRVFSVTSAIGFIVGFIMFGAIIYIPLYLQTAHGASPTSAGLQILPLVAGMLCTFIPSGRLVTRWGRYKIFPVVGTAVMAIGLYMLSLLTPTTTLFVSSIYMLVTGLGLGLVMQVLVVAAQNSVPYEQLGVATSTATFFRTIGGAFGVALFGAIFSNRLYADLKTFLPAEAWRQIAGKNIAANPAQLEQLPPAVHAGYVQAFSHSLDTVFEIGMVFCLVGFVLSLFLKEVPLRDRAFVPAAGPQPAAEF
jgi:predicted MFS family arabinose efflux permease